VQQHTSRDRVVRPRPHAVLDASAASRRTGSGKGTQAKRVAAHYEIADLASGDLLRREVERETPIGKIAPDYMRRGDLVPDETVL
jgi:hypothetical protein